MREYLIGRVTRASISTGTLLNLDMFS